MRTKIDRLDHQGRGIAGLDKVTFIPNALPSEEVEIELTESKSKYNVGKVLKYIKTSDKRVNPICPYYSLCGGCDLMHISYVDELSYKESKIKDIMKRYADIDNVSEIVGSKEEYGYRDKITLKVSKKIGLYQKNSHDIVNIDKCLLVSDKVNEIIRELNEMDLTGIYEIVIREGISGIMIILMCDGDINLDLDKLNYNIIKCYKGEYKVVKGQSYIIDEIGDMKYKISPTSFFQVNKYQVKNLYDLVLNNLDLSKDDVLLDLYCGTGTIGIYLASKVKEVLGIEINEEAILDANYNKELNNISNISFIAGDSKIIKSLGYKPNKIVVDPPRAGLSDEVVNEIMNINPERLVYVSCDPITLARDLKKLKEKYTVEKVIPVDMFPKTYHVETVCALERK